MQNGILFFKPLVTDVSRYTCLITKFAHRVNEISVRPKLPAPELLFHLRGLFENLPGPDAFQHPNYLGCALLWNRLNQKMNMVLIRPNFKKMDFISLFDLQTNLFQRLINCLIEHNSTIFGRTYEMIQQYRNIMRLMYIFAFAHTSKVKIFTPQAAGN